jgi:hypothetical protein
MKFFSCTSCLIHRNISYRKQFYRNLVPQEKNSISTNKKNLSSYRKQFYNPMVFSISIIFLSYKLKEHWNILLRVCLISPRKPISPTWLLVGKTNYYCCHSCVDFFIERVLKQPKNWPGRHARFGRFHVDRRWRAQHAVVLHASGYARDMSFPLDSPLLSHHCPNPPRSLVTLAYIVNLLRLQTQSVS